MANKPGPGKGANAAFGAIKKRYGTNWGRTTGGEVYDVVRESPIAHDYGSHNASSASALVAGLSNSKSKKKK